MNLKVVIRYGFAVAIILFILNSAKGAPAITGLEGKIHGSPHWEPTPEEPTLLHRQNRQATATSLSSVLPLILLLLSEASGTGGGLLGGGGGGGLPGGGGFGGYPSRGGGRSDDRRSLRGLSRGKREISEVLRAALLEPAIQARLSGSGGGHVVEPDVTDQRFVRSPLAFVNDNAWSDMIPILRKILKNFVSANPADKVTIRPAQANCVKPVVTAGASAIFG